jgi:hypothetical protein
MEFLKMALGAAKAAGGAALDMAGIGAAKAYLYGGLAITGLITALTLYSRWKRGVLDAERARVNDARLEAIARRRGLDDSLRTTPADQLRRRAERWTAVE